MALDRVALVLKIGDKITADGLEHVGVKNGQPISWIDEADPIWKGLPLEDILGPKSGKVFANLQVDRKLIPKLKTWCQPVLPFDQKNISYRPRPVVMPFGKLQSITGEKDLAAKLLDKDATVPLINGTMLNDTDFNDATVIPNERTVIDYNAVTTGTHDVGVGAPFYTTLDIAYADLGSPFTGDVAFRIISDHTVTATATITEDQAGYSFRTYGATNVTDPTTGYKIVSNVNFCIWFQSTASGAAVIAEFDNFKMEGLSNASNSCFFVGSGGVATPHINSFHNLILDGNGGDKTQHGFWYHACTDKIIHCYNNYIFDLKTYSIYWYSQTHASSLFEDISCDGLGNTEILYGVGGKTVILRNCLGIRPSSTVYGGVASSTGLNNAADDASCADGEWSTGSDNVPSITPVNHFVSLDSTNADYLKIKDDDTTIGDGGSVVSIPTNTEGIRGTPRPHGASYSIGADELALPPTGTVAIDNTVGEVSATGLSGTFGTVAIDNTVGETDITVNIGNKCTVDINSTVGEVSATAQAEVFAAVAITNVIATMKAYGSQEVEGNAAIVGTVPLLSASGYFSISKVIEETSGITLETTINSTIDI